MSFLLRILYLFFLGSVLGWCIEVIFRRFFSSANPERKWINPGFLAGPCIPLYGFSLCALYLLAGLEAYIGISSDVLRKLALFALMTAAVTLLEFLAGLLTVKTMHVKLWDYSREKGNVMGIICPKFTFFWMILSAAYYFFIHPHIISSLNWLSENLAFTFVIGFFYGVFFIDLAYSTQILMRIRRFADEHEIVVRYEELKEHIRQSSDRRFGKARFLLSMRSAVPFSEQLKSYYAKLQDALKDKPSLTGRGK